MDIETANSLEHIGKDVLVKIGTSIIATSAQEDNRFRLYVGVLDEDILAVNTLPANPGDKPPYIYIPGQQVIMYRLICPKMQNTPITIYIARSMISWLDELAIELNNSDRVIQIVTVQGGLFWNIVVMRSYYP